MTWSTKTIAGWGQVARATQPLARPERVSALKRLMSEGSEGVHAVGGLRAYGDAALNTAGRGIMTTRLDRFLAFDPQLGTLEVEAGVTIRDIIATIGPQGWMPAAVPGTGYATVGGCIATDVHGKNHHHSGSFGANVTGLDLLGADGRIRKIGPTKDTGLFKATVGGLGLTGIIVSAQLQLIPCRSMAMRVDERRMTDLDAFMDAFESSSAPYSVGWIDATASARRIGRGVLEEADFAAPDARPSKSQRQIAVPIRAPGFALSPPIVRAFNNFYFRRIPENGRVRERALTSFLFPLDQLLHWHRLYGRNGFHQFQCVLPEDGAREHLHAMLSEIAEAGVASPLTVLKRLGPSRAGYLSFPMAGWTLAVDLRVRPDTVALIGRLENRVNAAGGRVYLAKDALCRPGSIRSMYSESALFAEKVQKADPDGLFASDMSRRLELCRS